MGTMQTRALKKNAGVNRDHFPAHNLCKGTTYAQTAVLQNHFLKGISS